MANSHNRGAALERKAADILGGERILRGDNWGISAPDVVIPDFPHLKVDCKSRAKGWKHHSFLREILKYCEGEYDAPVLITKNVGERGECVTMTLEHFGAMLDAIRAVLGAFHELNESLPEDLRKPLTDEPGAPEGQ